MRLGRRVNLYNDVIFECYATLTISSGQNSNYPLKIWQRILKSLIREASISIILIWFPKLRVLVKSYRKNPGPFKTLCISTTVLAI